MKQAVKFTVENESGQMVSLEGERGTFVYIVPGDWFAENVKDNLPEGLKWGRGMSDYSGTAYGVNVQFGRMGQKNLVTGTESTASELFRKCYQSN